MIPLKKLRSLVLVLIFLVPMSLENANSQSPVWAVKDRKHRTWSKLIMQVETASVALPDTTLRLLKTTVVRGTSRNTRTTYKKKHPKHPAKEKKTETYHAVQRRENIKSVCLTRGVGPAA